MAAAMLNNEQEIDFERDEVSVTGPSNASQNGSGLLKHGKRKREDCLEIRQKIDRIEVKMAKLENGAKKQEEYLREIKALLHYICSQKKL